MRPTSLTLLLLLAAGCREIGPIDRPPPDLGTASFDAAPCGLALVSPAPGAVLDNGCFDHSDLITWTFAWSGCPGDEGYHLYVNQATAMFPFIDRPDLQDLSFTSSDHGYTLATTGWSWKVRRKVAGTWGAWSTERAFGTEAVDTDCLDMGSPPKDGG